MSAKRLAILLEIEARMQSLAGVNEVLLNASGDPSQFPAIFIDDAGHTPDSTTEPGATRYDMAVTIEGFVENDGGSAATAAINALYLSVVEALIQEPALDGLVEIINEGPMRMQTVALGKQRRMGFALDLEIQFVADRQSPAV